MHTISVIYRKPSDPQKYITFCQMPGDEFDEYFTKQGCMNYDVEYVSSRFEEDPFRRISKAEKEKLCVIHKPYEFLAGKMKDVWKY